MEFDHRHSGHCESGTVSALLRHRGLDLSEPMVFGIGGGLFFVHLPLIKMGGIPLTSYRSAPRGIIKNACKRLGVRMRHLRFRDQSAGMRALDELLAQGQPVGLQTCVFWLPYFPSDMRFQFNAHNLVAFGKRGNDYLLSDPVFEDTVVCASEDLRRARFAKGTFAPRGLLYYPEEIPQSPDLAAAVRRSIRHTCKQMLDVPMPFLGVRGIRRMARRLSRWPERLGNDEALVWVGTVVRMQEEIGTGGAGFRFMYAAFLQESAELLESQPLREAARAMTETGDRWRDFAVQGASLCKARESDSRAYARLSEILLECADREERIFRTLQKVV